MEINMIIVKLTMSERIRMLKLFVKNVIKASFRNHINIYKSMDVLDAIKVMVRQKLSHF